MDLEACAAIIEKHWRRQRLKHAAQDALGAERSPGVDVLRLHRLRVVAEETFRDALPVLRIKGYVFGNDLGIYFRYHKMIRFPDCLFVRRYNE